MAVMSFRASLPSEFDTAKSHILSSPKISSPSIQMSNTSVNKNSSYESVKQQTKSNRSALEPQGQP